MSEAIEAEIRSIELRLTALRRASVDGETLTDKDGPTVQGHIASAITKLERRRALLLGR